MEILHTALWSTTLPIGNNCSFLHLIKYKTEKHVQQI
jgi:hypothetical protein